MTPASSPASCEDVCSQREERDDFVGLMDENGVIGLLEALEIVGAGEYRVRKTQPDEAGYRRSDAAPGEDAHVFPPSPGEICKRVSVLNAADLVVTENVPRRPKNCRGGNAVSRGRRVAQRMAVFRLVLSTIEDDESMRCCNGLLQKHIKRTRQSVEEPRRRRTE